ncbi:unnamed protein product, partial [Effrenium voratum]
MASGASGACGACGGEFFWRLPSGAFCLEALEQAVGLAVPGDPPILKVAGWVAGRELEHAENAAPCRVRLESEDGVVEVGGPEDRAAVFAGCANSVWSGLVSLEPGTRLRLKGPSSFRLCCGRVRHALPGAVLGPFQGEEWFEVNCRKASQEAVIEMSEPRKERASAIGPGSAQGPVKEGGGAWRPVPWARLRPARWAKVAATSSGWADARGRPAAAPVWRQKRCEPRKPRLALMVVMAAVPPDSGVGCMTPNWTLLAALEEALCRACGAGGYELFVAPVAEEEQLERLQPSEVQRQLCRAGRWGMVYFLSPQRVQGQFRTKHDLVHDVPLFNLMEALERAGIPTVWPHPSHLYRILAGKEWPAQLCLSEQYRVPATTLVPRQAVEGDAAAAAAAQAAWGALGLLRAARGVGGV